MRIEVRWAEMPLVTDAWSCGRTREVPERWQGRDRGATVICSGTSAQTAMDCCGFYMDLHAGNIEFGHPGSH